jgi:drug/metabolite transporter (DMT)-like permease
MLPTLFPFVFAVLWASSYAAAKIGLADITPYLFVAVRLGIAALAAVLLVLAFGRSWAPVRRRWPHLLIGGALVHGLALGVSHQVLVTVAATPTALVHAFHPILTATLGVFLLGDTFRWWQWLGFALGLTGVLLGMPHDADYGVLALLALSLVGLSGGTLYLKSFAADVPPFEATAVQLVGGALLALAMMLAFETPHVTVTPSLIGAMTWTIALMSICGMAVYNLMIDRYGAAKAASGFFIVPGASAVIACVLLSERLPTIALFGLACATIGVLLVWWRPRTV